VASVLGLRLLIFVHLRVLQVRSLAESTGDVDSATPSLAVQMVGLNAVPTAGDEFYVCEDETMARKAAEVAEDAQVTFPLSL
jgi:translation initiation factor IF-2